MRLIITHVVCAGIGGMVGYMMGLYAGKMRADDESGNVDRMAVLYIVVGAVLVLIGLGTLNNQVELSHQRDRDQQQSECNKKIVETLVVSLNERTGISGEASKASLEQDKAFADLVRVLSLDPVPQPESERLFKKYQRALNKAVDLQEQVQKQRKENPYPTSDELAQCLEEADE